VVERGKPNLNYFTQISSKLRAFACRTRRTRMSWRTISSPTSWTSRPCWRGWGTKRQAPTPPPPSSPTRSWRRRPAGPGRATPSLPKAVPALPENPTTAIAVRRSAPTWTPLPPPLLNSHTHTRGPPNLFYLKSGSGVVTSQISLHLSDLTSRLSFECLDAPGMNMNIDNPSL
jgi:hypothetical protein